MTDTFQTFHVHEHFDVLNRAKLDNWTWWFSGDGNTLDDETKMPSCLDYVMHFLTVFWKVLFAFVPPTGESVYICWLTACLKQICYDVFSCFFVMLVFYMAALFLSKAHCRNRVQVSLPMPWWSLNRVVASENRFSSAHDSIRVSRGRLQITIVIFFVDCLHVCCGIYPLRYFLLFDCWRR